jgi:O-antigen/teichoic acid export membrane protein
LGGLLSLSPIFAAHFVSVTKVGYLSVGQSLVTAVGGLAAPLGMVLLPKVSSLLAQGREESIAKSINVYIIAILQCSVFICLQLIIFSDLLIVFWLGKNFVEAVWIVRTSFFASFFYLFYVSMRSIIDAVKVRAVNTINLLVSFLLFVLSSSFVLLPGSNALVVLNASFAGGIVCLAALTYFSLRKIYPCQLSQELRFFLPAFGVSCFLALVSFAVKPFVTNIAYLAGYEILIGTFYLFILFYFKTGWVLEAFEATLNKK